MVWRRRNDWSARTSARWRPGRGRCPAGASSLALISASFPAEERGRAIGTWSGFTAIDDALGPVLWGWLVQHASWRWVFFINLPIALVVVAITAWRIPEARSPGAHPRLDWPRCCVDDVWASAESCSPSSNPRRWPVSLAARLARSPFLVLEGRSSTPMLPLGLFRSRDFAGANLLTLFLYAALNGVLFIFPMNLIQVQRYSATEAGAALLPFILLMFVLPLAGRGLMQRYGAKGPLAVRAPDRRGRVRPVRERTCALAVRTADDVLSGGGGPGQRNGHEYGAAYDHGDELRLAEPGWSGDRGINKRSRASPASWQ